MQKKPNSITLLADRVFTAFGFGMRAKLITLFIVIKVIPLVLLAVVAWRQSWGLGEYLQTRTQEFSTKVNDTLVKAGTIAVDDAVTALNNRAVEDIERMTTDTALQVAHFLYERDGDVLFAATLKPDTATYRQFLTTHTGRILKPGSWRLAEDGNSWEPEHSQEPLPQHASSNRDNDQGFHYRQPNTFVYETRPLFLEMTFVGLDGKEQVKVTTSSRMNRALVDISHHENTYVKAERYFEELKKLKPGEIYVSDVIGAYVGSRIIGTYTPENAEKAGIPFEPEKSAYAGMENPVGERFKGLVRWATPVEQNGKVIGYVTLALDHDHLMEFTDHLIPTQQRYTELPDASAGNYAFIWDYQGRSIVHPRHFSIVGYNPQTGDPQIPWLEDSIYDEWQASGKNYVDFIKGVPTFVDQSQSKKPARALTGQGLVGLDCRYLNFAPQCVGWFDLTQDGGSGSFQILWSGLWKLSTAAAIPYYTGKYGQSKRGFGFVTIGAGVDDFHRPAMETKKSLDALIQDTDVDLRQAVADTQTGIAESLWKTAASLGVSTTLMAALVILVAIWMASVFTRRITSLIDGFSLFRRGHRQFRFNAVVKDEMGRLADSFDAMADSIVKNINYPLAIVDTQRNIIYMNEQCLDKNGYRLEDVVGKPYYEYSIFEEGSPEEPLGALLAGREPAVMFFAPQQRYFKGIAMPLMDLDGQQAGYVISMNDVTEIIHSQRKIEEQKSLLDSMFASLPDLIWYKNTQGVYLAVNPRFCAFMGMSAEEIVGHSSEQCVVVDDAEALRRGREADRQVLGTGVPLSQEERFLFSDGHEEIVESVRTPVRNAQGTVVGLLGVARDITRRVAVEKDLRETQHSLQEAAQAANRASVSKSEFLARMSHEIRTPMNAIIGMTSIIQRKLEQTPVPMDELRTHVGQIGTSSRHLLGLLNDILDISKIEAGKIEISSEPFVLLHLMDNIHSIISPRCAEKNITFTCTHEGVAPQSLVGDPLRLRQVLINLLGNAVKFTAECGRIDFDVTPVGETETTCAFLFSIQDNGIGMNEEVLAGLFTPFEQGGLSITKKYGGTGLGLSISRNIVRLMGGDIVVKSKEGDGSVFSFHLEFKKSIEAVDSSNEAVQTGALALRGKRVLLVDDVFINRVIVIEQLADSGLEIEEAEDGSEAVEKFSASPNGYYDLIFMDIQMPTVSGYEATRSIRALSRPDAATVPIVAMTANAFKEDVDQALASGMNGHLAKPLEVAKLMLMLQRYLGGDNAQAQ